LNFKIVCHLAELDGVSKFAENAYVINVWQLLQAKRASFLLKSHARPMVISYIHWPGLAAIAESSKSVKTPISTNLSLRMNFCTPNGMLCL